MGEFKSRGIIPTEEKVDKFLRLLSSLVKKREVPLEELFPPKFIRNNTRFRNIREMLGKIDLETRNNSDLEKLLQTKLWDTFIAENTCFSNWEEMKEKAVMEWMRRKLEID